MTPADGHTAGLNIVQSSETAQDYPDIQRGSSEIDERVSASHSRVLPDTTPLSPQRTLEDSVSEGENDKVNSLAQKILQTEHERILAEFCKFIHEIPTSPGETYGSWKGEDGTSFKGNLLNNLPHGEGIMTYPNGSRYEGDFQNGQPHGQGMLFYSNGSRYKGDFQNGQRHGQGIIIYADGLTQEGQFKNDQLQGNVSHLSNLNWIGNLIGSEYGLERSYALGIMSDYLKEKTDYKKEGEALERAYQIALLSQSEVLEESKKIHQRLTEENGQPQLLPYGMKSHGMLLNLVPYTSDEGEKFIDCEIFNSGEGLEKSDLHPKLEIHKSSVNGQKIPEYKSQTMLRIRVPIANFTSNTIEHLLRYKDFTSIDEAYHTILDIDEAKIIPSDPKSEVWQKAQKGHNCASKCIFVYLKHKMKETDYNDMRLHLFEDCIQAIENNPKKDSTYSTLGPFCVNELKRKIEKRKKRNNIFSFVERFEGEKITLPNGIRYKGGLLDGQPHGKGIMIDAGGTRYYGDFQHGLRHGEGTLNWADCLGGGSYQGQFRNGYIKSNSSHLGDSPFLKLFFGTNVHARPPEYALGVMSDYLKQNGYSQASDLESAHQTYLLHPDEVKTESQKIYKNLTTEKKSQLLAYGTSTHAMLLNLIPYTSETGEEFINCQLFNSGAGLEHAHRSRHLESEGDVKYQTMLQVKVRMDQWSADQIEKLLNWRNFQSTREAYQYIYNLSGSENHPHEIIELDPTSDDIWHRAQKGCNCSRKCLFSYLAYTMTEIEYNEMEIKLFEACIKKAEQNRKLKPNERAQIIREFERRIKKRKEKLAKLLDDRDLSKIRLDIS